MNKGFRLVTMVALSLVLLAGISLVGCGDDDEQEPIQNLDVELYQYLKGATVDMDDATINSAAEGAGEGAANTMGMGFSPALAGQLPACKEYANLNADQKEIVSAWVVAFLGSVDEGIELYTNGTVADLTTNPAYVLLHELSGSAWFGKWGQGAWPAKQAFWATWTDPAGRGGQCEFTDWVALNGLATATGNDDYTWAGGTTKYAELSADDRADVDADLAAFYTKLEAEATAAAVTNGATAWLMANALTEMLEAVAAGNAAGPQGSPEFVAAYSAYLGTNYPEVYTGMVGASMDVARATEAWPLLKTLGKPAADGWAADIDAGVHPRQALFRWIAKPALLALAGLGVLVELSVGEFSFKITNPNEYFVSVDNLSINISVNADGTAAFGAAIFPALDVDAAKLAVGDKIWIPEAKDGVDGEVIVKLSAPIKWLDMVTWLVMGGYDSDTAGGYAMDVWAQIHIAGTAVFDVTVEATISSEEETITQSFDLTWTPAA